MNDNSKENHVNYYYINRSLELTRGVPATVLVAWLPTLILLNFYSIIFSILGSVLIVYLHRSGYTIIEFISILKFVIRDRKPRIFNGDEKYVERES